MAGHVSQNSDRCRLLVSAVAADTIYVVYPQTRYVSRAVRALIDTLAAAFEQAPPVRVQPVPA